MWDLGNEHLLEPYLPALEGEDENRVAKSIGSGRGGVRRLGEHPPTERGGARDALYVLVLVRFCQSLVIARHTVILHPENKDYLMSSAYKGAQLLHWLWKTGKEAVLRKWVDDAREYSDRK